MRPNGNRSRRVGVLAGVGAIATAAALGLTAAPAAADVGGPAPGDIVIELPPRLVPGTPIDIWDHFTTSVAVDLAPLPARIVISKADGTQPG